MPRRRPQICRCRPHLRAAAAEAAKRGRAVLRGAGGGESRRRGRGKRTGRRLGGLNLGLIRHYCARWARCARQRDGAAVARVGASSAHAENRALRKTRARARAHRQRPPPSRPPAAPPWPPARALRGTRWRGARQPATKAGRKFWRHSTRRRPGGCAQPRAQRTAVCTPHAASARGGTYPARPQRRRRAAGPPPACRPPQQ